jgi:hypothetical protein
MSKEKLEEPDYKKYAGGHWKASDDWNPGRDVT